MEFFRKYQRLILYSAGIFALVSFSISGAMLAVFGSLFQGEIPMPTVDVAGHPVKITVEDDTVATSLIQRERSFNIGGGSRAPDPATVQPRLFGPGNQDDRRTVYAALRRLAIAYGIDASGAEVDRAIEHALALASVESPAALAQRNGFMSLESYRRSVQEAMRIGNFVRLQALVPEQFDHALVDQIVGDAEFLTLDVASLDAKALQEAIEADDVSDDDLQVWIDELDASARRDYIGPDLYRIEMARIDIASFDPAAFAEELGEIEFSDEEILAFYERHQASLFAVAPEDSTPEDGTPEDSTPEDGTPEVGPPEDGAPDEGDEQEPQTPEFRSLEDSREAIIRRLQAERLLGMLWDDLRNQVDASDDAETEARDAASQASLEARTAAGEARLFDGQNQTEESAAKKEEAEALETQAQADLDAAQDALNAKRAAFDLQAALAEKLGDRGGVIVTITEEPQNIDQLRDLGDLGTWEESYAITQLGAPGMMSSQIYHLDGSVFHFRVVEAIKEPLKPFDELREQARGDYFAAKADEQAEERKEAFESSLSELARAQIGDRIAEIEAERDADLETRMAEWEAKLQDEVALSQADVILLEEKDPGSRALTSAKVRLDRLHAELADKDGQRAALSEELQAEADAEIDEAAREEYGAVLAQAAEANGFELQQVGPYRRGLQRTGVSAEVLEPAAGFLFWSTEIADPRGGIQSGETTDLLEDRTNRVYYLAFAREVTPLTLADMSRRELMQSRDRLAGQRGATALWQSFTTEALQQRFGWRRSDGQFVEPAGDESGE